MFTDLTIPAQLPAYMVGTTVVRVAIYVFGVFLAARLTPLKNLSKVAAIFIVSIMLVGWTLLIINLGRNNVFRIDASTTFPPPIIFAVLIPIIVGYIAFRSWYTLRQIIFHIPQHWLIGIQVFRITGGMILVLYLRGLLPAEFGIPVGMGDILIGITAIPVAYFCYKQKPWSRKLALLWNYAGIADFVVAVPLGILTSPSPIQLLALDAPNLLTTTYPTVLFPTFSVPAGIILHLYSLAWLRRNEATEKTIPTAWRWLLFFAGAIFVYATIFYLVMPAVTSRPIGFQIHPSLQQTFAAHPIGIYVHIIPSMLAIILGPFQFLESFRNKHLKVHRWFGRIYLFGGVLGGGLGGLYMAQFATGGLVSELGFGLLAVLWLATGSMAYVNVRRGRIEVHQEWMIRNYALTFAAVTLRLYTRTFFLFGLTLPDFHPINAWLCWIPNLVFAEWLIYRARTQSGETKKTLRATGS